MKTTPSTLPYPHPPPPAQAKAGPQVIFLLLFLVNNYHFTSSFLKKIDLLVSIST